MEIQFLLHIMLSMGQFRTKIGLITHTTLQEILHYAKLIGPYDEHDEIRWYSNDLQRKFIREQLSLFPNSKMVIDGWIIISGELFDSIINNREIMITDMLSVQQNKLFANMEDATN